MEEDDVHDYQEEEEDYVNDDGDPADEFDFNDDARFSFADNHFDEDIKDNAPELHEKYKVVVGKVRTIVRFFKCSPVKNDLLQSYVKAECSKERKLLLDCKTRWSSLSDMLHRFYELRKPVKKALVDLDGGDKLDLDEMEMELVCEISTALKPLKAAVEALCRRDANLLTADAILSFALNKLRELNTELSNELFEALEKRINERRSNLSGALKYLHNGSFSSAVENENDDSSTSAEVLEIFDPPSRKTVENVFLQMLTRLEPIENDVECEQSTQEVAQTTSSHQQKNKKRSRSELHKELDSAIEKA
ncbi:hypothetical protein Bhyg_01429, partial [Pseudolycoriella hygida]